jgi:hypothetical protein
LLCSASATSDLIDSTNHEGRVKRLIALSGETQKDVDARDRKKLLQREVMTSHSPDSRLHLRSLFGKREVEALVGQLMPWPARPMPDRVNAQEVLAARLDCLCLSGYRDHVFVNDCS